MSYLFFNNKPFPYKPYPKLSIKLSFKLSIAALFFALAIPARLGGMGFVLIGENQYLALNQLLESTPQISHTWNPLTLILELKYEEHWVKLEIGAPYYISGGYQVSLNLPPLVHQGAVYLPRSLVEELFTEFQLPIKYKFEESRVETVKAQPLRRLQTKLDFIVIDPGHGGRDPGAFGSNVQEKKITLEVSQHLFYHLKKAFPETTIYITRFDDTYITLEGRGVIANKKFQSHDFGIFISIHCNSALTSKVHGYEIFYLAQNPSSEEARQVMMRENRLIDNSANIGSLESFLLDSQLLAESKALARQMDTAFRSHLNGSVSSRGVRRADFAVLRHSLMPAVLLELGYITNSAEARMLQTKKYRDKFSAGVEAAIKSFMENRPGL